MSMDMHELEAESAELLPGREALGKLSPDRAASQTDIRNLIDRVVIGRATIRIQLSDVAEGTDSARILTLPWTRRSPYCKREIRPMPARCRPTRARS